MKRVSRKEGAEKEGDISVVEAGNRCAEEFQSMS